MIPLFHWCFKEDLYEEAKENRQERRHQSQSFRRRNPTEFIKVSEWNIERCTATNYMIKLTENLTGKFLD